MKNLLEVVRVVLLTGAWAICTIASSDTAESKHVNVPNVTARQEAVQSIDGLMHALYEVLSGPSGQPRDWARDRTLYLDDCHFIWWEKLKSNLAKVRARGGELFVFADPGVTFGDRNGIHTMRLPASIQDLQAPIIYTIPLQLLACHVAVLKGTDVDQARNLAKSVTSGNAHDRLQMVSSSVIPMASEFRFGRS